MSEELVAEIAKYPEHEGHDCPQCGAYQNWCHIGTATVRHAHRCNGCGTIWQHASKFSQEAINNDCGAWL